MCERGVFIFIQHFQRFSLRKTQTITQNVLKQFFRQPKKHVVGAESSDLLKETSRCAMCLFSRLDFRSRLLLCCFFGVTEWLSLVFLIWCKLFTYLTEMLNHARLSNQFSIYLPHFRYDINSVTKFQFKLLVITFYGFMTFNNI